MSSTDLIRTFLTDRLGVQPEQVTPEALLAELGVDSLMLAELMFEAEDRLHISIDDGQAVPVTVGDMHRIIAPLLAAKNAEA